MIRVKFHYVVRFLSIFTIPLLQPLQGQNDVKEITSRLTRTINHELAQKKLSAVYIALVERDTILWSHAFGYADPDRKLPATIDDVHRIASVSKLFTDIGMMQLVEQGIVDLDAPVNRYLPDFHPNNPYGTEITLRQLMTHRAGLVREPPAGSYFDPTEPSLSQTVASLNETALVYRPETRFKYSNAGITVVGSVLEHMRGQSFARSIEETVLRPMGLNNSSFEPKPELLKRKPRAFLWTYDGRVFDAPAFQFGIAPAANMYSTIGDLATFMITLFNGGKGSGGRILKKETLEAMWEPQFAPQGQNNGVGLGFFIGTKGDYRVISHSGDVYGFATEFVAIPQLKVGVIVVNTMNAANAWSSTMADYALDLMVARATHKSLPDYPLTQEVTPVVRKRLLGKYANDQYAVRMYERGNRLMIQSRTMNLAVRQRGNDLILDDKISIGTPVQLFEKGVILGRDSLLRVPDSKPRPVPDRWKGLIGEYGWDHNTLYIQEREGVLHAQIEWYFSYPLKEISPDVFAFPDFGLYHGEQLRFNRLPDGSANEVVAAGVLFARRPLGTKETFTIVPRKPIDQLQHDALASSPPLEQGTFRIPDLVELVKLDSTIHLDIRYATTNNFMKAVFYSEPRAFVQRPTAESLVKANRWLKKFGYGLLIHDAYRPWYVTKMFWDATPDDQRDFVADPSKGSRHNRGCAVDVTLYNLSTGAPADMVSGYDEFSVRAYPDYPGGTSLEQWNREVLRRALELQGFEVYVYEWWHFDHKDWGEYPILNLRFQEIR